MSNEIPKMSTRYKDLCRTFARERIFTLILTKTNSTMKKFIYATLALAAVLLFASCKNDKNQPKAEAGDAYVSFTFNLPQGGFRDGVADKTAGQEYAGTTAEQAINAVRVVLYDPASGAAKYSFDYAITGDGTQAPTGAGIAPNGTAATTARFTTKAKEVVSQDYLMLAIINPSAKVKAATVEGKTLLDAQAAITTTASELSGAGIMMSNEQGLVKVAPANMKDAEAAAEQAPVAVSVDRILAKVFVGTTAQSGTPDLPDGVTFENIKWQLNTTNKKTFIYRQFGQVMTTKDNFVAEVAGDNSTRFNRYAQDPNFSGAFNGDDFEYLVDVPTLSQNFGYADANGQYCLENTMEAASQKIQQTTSFILSGTWTPKGFTKGETWYSYQGLPISVAKMKDYIAEAKNPAKDADQQIVGTPVGFKAALKAVLAMNDCPVADDGTIKNNSFVAHDIKGYKDGVCYYQSNLIRHFNDDQSSANMGYGRYGVVRNNIYKINIKAISQPGEPTVVPDKDKPGKDDPSKVFVAFDVTINPWIVRTQDISL
ncbi:Major fimbrial subunit protein (FimA) [Chlamydia trachomatis]|nr:Major fimbrial subunit protein (FimA) [Chlamydia trachomatis]